MRFFLLPLFIALATAFSGNPFLNNEGASGDNSAELAGTRSLIVGTPAAGFIDPKQCTVNDGCDNTFSSIDKVNSKIRSSVADLVQTDFFKYFKLQLYKSCPFWQENPMCFSPSCAVEIDFDNEDKWNKDYFAASSNDSSDAASHHKKIVEYNCDYCNTAEEHQEDAVYLDLTLNPERFSGYGGEESGRIWRAIYQENCFNKASGNSDESSSVNKSPLYSNKYFNLLASWSNRLQKNLNINNSNSLDSLMNQAEDQCLEKRVFYRLISGMHASIACHLSFEWLDSTKKNAQFEPNLQLFMERVGYHADRLSNVYFNYSLVTKAILKLADYLNQIQFSSDNSEKELIGGIINLVKPYEKSIFNEGLLFNYEDDLSNQYLKNEFKSNFKNVSSLMDCVGCERCRLWGKVQTLGYGTALKILFELNDQQKTDFDVKSLKRSEVVALVNTFDRLSKSVHIINYFRNQYAINSSTGDVSQAAVEDAHSREYEDLNNKMISYQQKIFKGLHKAHRNSDTVEQADESNEDQPNSIDSTSEPSNNNVDYGFDSYPSSVKAKNVDDSKKQLNKLFKNKKKSNRVNSDGSKLIRYDNDDDDYEDGEDLEVLTKEEIRYRRIFKNSIRLKNSKPFDQKTFNDHILEVVEEFKDVFRFMWRSYVDFPKNLYNIAMSRLEVYWNLFIGNEEFFLEKKRELHRLNHSHQ